MESHGLLPAHEIVTGETRSGKTWYAISKLEEYKGPVLFFNAQGEYRLSRAVRVERGEITLRKFISLISNGKKVDYVPSMDLKIAREEANRLCAALFVAATENLLPPEGVLCGWDEAQDLAPEGQHGSGLQMLARRGLGKGIKCIFICQRPADISKVVISQSTRKVFFAPSNWDETYLSRYHFPGEVIKSKTNREEHTYMLIEDGELSGPFKAGKELKRA